MKRQKQNKSARLFLLDMRSRIDVLEEAFRSSQEVRNVIITSYDENRSSRTPQDNTNFSVNLPLEFDIYMVHLPFTTQTAISKLREDKPSAFIWVNSMEGPWRLDEKLKSSADGFYSAASPDYQVRKVMDAWRGRK